jgi:hypothetical protein
MGKGLYAGIAVLAILITLPIIYNLLSPVVAEGIVDHKAVVGVVRDTAYTILTVRLIDKRRR